MRRQSLFLRVAVFTAALLSVSSIALAQTIKLQGTIRDFNDTHPDFQSYEAVDPGIVLPDIGADKKPVYAGLAGNPTTHGETEFDQWYRDTAGVNLPKQYSITLVKKSDSDIYEYSNNSFFPIDDQLFGNQGRVHNYHFTYEIHTTFTYNAGDTFSFTGDDDLWLFLNGKLAIDLGGVHPAMSASVDLDAQAAALGLVPGNTYDFDLFFAERHTSQSNFQIQTTIVPHTGPVMDVKPRSCPNPLNVKPFENLPPNGKPMKGGVLPVAILGSNEFDVQDIDVSSLLLEGVPPLRNALEDVATPADGEDCDCTTVGPDGYMDLTLKFAKSEIVAAIGPVENGDLVEVTLSGALLDGTTFEAHDCVLIRAKDSQLPSLAGDDGPVLGPAVPNPFNPVTRISYVLPGEGYARLAVYDVAGRLVDQLIAGIQPAGEHVIEWNAAGLESGIYFYRLEFGNTVRTSKMILLK